MTGVPLPKERRTAIMVCELEGDVLLGANPITAEGITDEMLRGLERAFESPDWAVVREHVAVALGLA